VLLAATEPATDTLPAGTATVVATATGGGVVAAGTDLWPNKEILIIHINSHVQPYTILKVAKKIQNFKVLDL